MQPRDEAFTGTLVDHLAQLDYACRSGQQRASLSFNLAIDALFTAVPSGRPVCLISIPAVELSHPGRRSAVRQQWRYPSGQAIDPSVKIDIRQDLRFDFFHSIFLSFSLLLFTVILKNFTVNRWFSSCSRNSSVVHPAGRASRWPAAFLTVSFGFLLTRRRRRRVLFFPILEKKGCHNLRSSHVFITYSSVPSSSPSVCVCVCVCL